ncbi:uncharacterized protein BCR38DRAFT_486023 [Pseudomassariella vexata]|uniref:Uncharacterized protein n=1 Tax=Pseudomassariella vexata TaxID=1141098 RepID=A0A1Y2DVY5_9PEZI|nr:uncharacterized protein BCR38DRAFT_486023 [Pseudomassariella vexata]ORY63274.1 hypothetical protein BCR38DRAFT_486023 [Pseudomassariella vexata]
MTWVFQLGLTIESVLNILGAGTFLLYPEWCLSYTVSTPKVPASAATLWQTYAVLVLALTFPILLCIPNSKGVFEKRKIIFETLVAGEVALVGLLLWHAVKPAEESGFMRSGLILATLNLLPALTWHSFCIWGVPGLMVESGSVDAGREKEL